MNGTRPLTSRGVLERSERERTVGLDADDDAARWLEENAPRDEIVAPISSKSSRKSKTLHRWRNRQARDT